MHDGERLRVATAFGATDDSDRELARVGADLVGQQEREHVGVMTGDRPAAIVGELEHAEVAARRSRSHGPELAQHVLGRFDEIELGGRADEHDHRSTFEQDERLAGPREHGPQRLHVPHPVDLAHDARA